MFVEWVQFSHHFTSCSGLVLVLWAPWRLPRWICKGHLSEVITQSKSLPVLRCYSKSFVRSPEGSGCNVRAVPGIYQGGTSVFPGCKCSTWVVLKVCLLALRDVPSVLPDTCYLYLYFQTAIELKIQQCQFWLHQANLILKWIDDVSQLLSLGKFISALKVLNKK